MLARLPSFDIEFDSSSASGVRAIGVQPDSASRFDASITSYDTRKVPLYCVHNRTLFCDAYGLFLCSVLVPCLAWVVLKILVDSGACVSCVSGKFAKTHNLIVDGDHASRTLNSACAHCVFRVLRWLW